MSPHGLERWLWYSVRRAGLDRDLGQAAKYMQGRVLEIGCGRKGRRGAFKPPLTQCARWTTLDLDVSRQPEVVGNAQQLPYGQRCFDTVVCLEVLEYVEEPRRVLSEIARVLRPTGHLVLSVPFLHRMDTDDDLWRFTEQGLRRLLVIAGFRIVWFTAQGSALGVATNVLRYAIAAQPPGWGRRVLGITARPFLVALNRLDGTTAARQPVLATFSTGYLAVASL